MNKEQRINQLNEIKADCALFVEQMKERMDTLTNNSDHVNGSNISHICDRLVQFNNELQEYEMRGGSKKDYLITYRSEVRLSASSKEEARKIFGEGDLLWLREQGEFIDIVSIEEEEG